MEGGTDGALDLRVKEAEASLRAKSYRLGGVLLGLLVDKKYRIQAFSDRMWPVG
jgi:hypothetical protein